MSAFTDIQNATADVLDSSFADAGYLIGLFAIILIAMILYYAVGSMEFTILGSAGGAIFNILIGWWPIWTALFIVLIVVLLFIGMPGMDSRRNSNES